MGIYGALFLPRFLVLLVDATQELNTVVRWVFAGVSFLFGTLRLNNLVHNHEDRGVKAASPCTVHVAFFDDEGAVE